MPKTVKVDLTIPHKILEQIFEIEKLENKNINQILIEALKKYLISKQWGSIQVLGLRKSKQLGIKNEDDVVDLIHEYRKNSAKERKGGI